MGYLPQGTYAKVGTPRSGQDRGRGYPKVPTLLSQGRYLHPARSGWRRGTPRYLPPAKVGIPPSWPKMGVPQGTYPPVQGRYPSSQVRMGGKGTPRYLPPSQDRYPPPPRDRTAYGVLDTLQSVCLLHSCRRTFLFSQSLEKNECAPKITNASWHTDLY